MNEGRFCHSSCTLGSKIYVYGGQNAEQNYLDTVEYLDMEYCKIWTSVKLDQLLARKNSHLCPLKDGEILIFGGHYEENKLQDISAFDVKDWNYRSQGTLNLI